jgi:hypothetical protein
MNDIPSTLTYTESIFRKQWDLKLYQKQRRFVRGTGYKGLTPGDAMLGSIKNGLQSYSMHSDAERLGKLVVKMVGIESKNIEYLSAAIFLYNTYSNELETSKDISKEMFDDDTPAIKKIREKLDKAQRNTDKKDAWTARKINILAYLTSIIDHIAEGQEDFQPSQAYNQQQLKKKEKEVEEDEEAEEEAEDDENGTGNIPEDFESNI